MPNKAEFYDKDGAVWVRIPCDANTVVDRIASKQDKAEYGYKEEKPEPVIALTERPAKKGRRKK